MAQAWQRRLRDTFLLGFAATALGCSPAIPQGGKRSGAATAAAGEAAEVTLVESVPLETSLDHPTVPDAASVWPAMIDGARETVDLAEFYASEAESEAHLKTSRLTPVVQALERAAARGVRVRFLADELFGAKYPATLDRLARAGATVRRLDVSKTSGGVLHAKYFVVDGRDSFIGSQNFDWRALAHIFEMGVRVRSRDFGAALLDLFETDWQIAGGSPTTTRIGGHAGAGAALRTSAGDVLRLVASPRGWLPDERDWDLPRIVALVDGARTHLDVEVLTYKTTNRDGSSFTILDEALRRAAGRGVAVRLLVSDWSTKPGSDARRDLESLARLPNVEVRVLTIPPWSGGEIPFARVAHAKFMAVDRAAAWVGTSNWEGDYFTHSRNVGVIAVGASLAKALDDVFAANWQSPYASRLALTAAPTAGEAPRGP